MRWTYDADARALYLYLGDGSPCRQVEVFDGLIVDQTAEGVAVGVELIALAPDLDLEVLAKHGVDEAGVKLLGYLVMTGFAVGGPAVIEVGETLRKEARIVPAPQMVLAA